MAPIHVSFLPIVCWGLMFSLATTIQALNATRIELFHSVAHDASPNPLATSISAILASTSDLVVITTPLTSTDAANDNKTDTRELLKTYSLIGANRILYKPANWTVESEALVNSTVWTRLKSTNTYACIVVDTAKNNESEAVISSFIDRLDSFCGAQDNVVLGFTSSVSDELSSYLQGRTSQKKKIIPRTMGETSALARQGLGDASSDTSAALTTAQNRLYVHSADIACLETASVDSTAETVGVKMTFCMGSECAPCQQQGMLENNPESSESQRKSSKLGLVVLLSCGTFLLGCGLVFYILFHKQFFLPDGNGKMEKEVATNLAYVLRV